MSKKIAVVLVGCGHQDSSEVTEAVSTILTLSELNVDYQCFAPEKPFPSQNHLAQELDGGSRDMLVEAARIARGDVKPLSELNVEEFDGLAIPGGNGVALHMSDWFQNGSGGKTDENLATIIKKFHEGSRPICAICIAPVLLAQTLGDTGVSLTVGDAAEVEAEIDKTGAEAVKCPANDFVTDRLNKVITTPAYMYGDAKPFDVYTGIRKALHEFVEMS